MKVKDYMKRSFRAVPSHAPMKEVARAFFETNDSILPVTESDGTLSGVISIDDFILIFLPDYIDLIRNIDFIHDFGALEKASYSIEEMLFVAEDLQRENYPVLDENDSIMKAAAVLHRTDIQTIPVVNDDKLVGMISKNDFCRAVFNMEGRN